MISIYVITILICYNYTLYIYCSTIFILTSKPKKLDIKWIQKYFNVTRAPDSVKVNKNFQAVKW